VARGKSKAPARATEREVLHAQVVEGNQMLAKEDKGSQDAEAMLALPGARGGVGDVSSAGDVPLETGRQDPQSVASPDAKGKRKGQGQRQLTAQHLTVQHKVSTDGSTGESFRRGVAKAKAFRSESEEERVQSQPRQTILARSDTPEFGPKTTQQTHWLTLKAAHPQIGMKARVTNDLELFERECRTLGLSWPNRQDGEPRPARMDLEGIIRLTEKSGLLVFIDNDVGWIPTRAVVGMSPFQAVHPTVGMKASVTADAAIYERECRAAGLSWPNRPEGTPRSAKIGCEGEIERVERGDSLVYLSGGVMWVPTRSLVGFESFQARKGKGKGKGKGHGAPKRRESEDSGGGFFGVASDVLGTLFRSLSGESTGEDDES